MDKRVGEWDEFSREWDFIAVFLKVGIDRLCLPVLASRERPGFGPSLAIELGSELMAGME